MLTNAEKQKLKDELLKLQKEALKNEASTKQDASIQESSGELSMYDNHPADMGTALYDREKDRALHEHAQSEIGKIQIALKAMENGTYGTCEVCQKDISYERLLIVPYTTFCVEHAEEVEQSLEEDTALNEVENPFQSTQDPDARDYENSFEEVAEFGTSDSPSDFTDSAKPTYMDDNQRDFKIDQMVEKSVTDNTDEDTTE